MREIHGYRDFHAIRALADAQDGVLSTAQLREAGFDRGAIQHRRRSGLLVPVTRGVWALGRRRLGPRGYLWVAHLATGAPIARRSAAWAHNLLTIPSMPVEVLSTGAARSRRGIRVHHTTGLEGHEVVTLDGLPVTSVARTILDCPPRLTRRLLHEAAYHRTLDRTALLTSHPSSARTVQTLDRIAPTLGSRAKSELEHEFLDIVDRLGIPPPLHNRPFAGRERDFRWPDRNLVAEVDGRAAHERAATMAADRRRDRELLLQHGTATIRFVAEDFPDEVARALAALFLR